MKEAPLPRNESSRIEALRSYRILDTLPESSYDDITKLASHICNTPISVISFVDSERQWFKSKTGVEISETPREIAFCAHAILKPDVFMVPDTLADERFADNPMVTGGPRIRFYAAAPLITAKGEAIGTLCAIDKVPRTLDRRQQDLLHSLSRQVMIQLELRRHILEQERQQRRLQEYQKELKKTNAKLQEVILTDDVSGYYNTRFLHQFLDYYLQPGQPGNRMISLVFFDMDDFKLAVDRHGHLLGSKILRQVADTVNRFMGPEDYLVRYGGDEYIVIMPGQDKQKSFSKIKQMKRGIEKTPYLPDENINIHLTASFGLATCPDDALDKHQLLAEADRCLFRSKEKGKACITTRENF